MATIAEKWIEEGMQKGIQQGMHKGREEGMWDVVRSSLKEGLPIKTIVRITGIPAEKINIMKEKMAMN